VSTKEETKVENFVISDPNLETNPSLFLFARKRKDILVPTIKMSLFTKVWSTSIRTTRQKMSTTTLPSEVTGSGALLTAVGTTFLTYMTADFLSNFIQHPSQKVIRLTLYAFIDTISL
jgi:hypothetical protein